MSFFEYLQSNVDYLIELAVEHLVLVAVSMAIALTIAVVLGIVAHRVSWARSAVLNFCSTMLTIPSFALFALMLPVFSALPFVRGIGMPPTVGALVLYALLPIVRNTVSGLNSLDPAITESARGMGMSKSQTLWRVELPMAWPVILTGIRVSTQLIIGIAAIAALIGGPGLGQEIFRGIRSLGGAFANNLVYGGTLAIVILAVAVDVLFLIIGRLTTSRGIRD